MDRQSRKTIYWWQSDRSTDLRCVLCEGGKVGRDLWVAVTGTVDGMAWHCLQSVWDIGVVTGIVKGT